MLSPGLLRFAGVEDLTWTDQGHPPAIDAAGERDYGHIDSLTADEGIFRLEGDWGRMELRAQTLEVELLDPTNGAGAS